MINAADLIAKFRQALEEKWGYIWGTAGELWTEAKQRKLEQTTDDDRKSGREYGSKWIGHKVTDCSGLFSWAYAQLGGTIYHGSNTMWDQYCTSQGKLKNGQRTDGRQLLPGTAVFCYNTSTKRRSHVGLYIGDGYVIEASGTINGVIKVKVTNRKWVEWGQLKGVDYETGGETVPDTKTETRPTLRRGSKGEWVRQLQEMLMARGYDVGSAGADGIYGKGTQAAVTTFQMDNCLALDGIVGPDTWGKLDEIPEKEKTFSVMICGLSQGQASELLKQWPEANVIEERR